MEIKINSVSVSRDVETGRRSINLNTSTPCFKRIKADTWEVYDSNQLKISLASFAHFLNAATDDLSIDISFLLMDLDEEQLRYALMGATVDVAQELVPAGTVVKDDDGSEFAAQHDFFRITTLKFLKVTHVGRVALDYAGTEPFNGRSAEIKKAYILDRREVAK